MESAREASCRRGTTALPTGVTAGPAHWRWSIPPNLSIGAGLGHVTGLANGIVVEITAWQPYASSASVPWGHIPTLSPPLNPDSHTHGSHAGGLLGEIWWQCVAV